MADANGKGKSVAMQGDKASHESSGKIQNHGLVGVSSSPVKMSVVGAARLGEEGFKRQRRNLRRRPSINSLVFGSSTSQVQPLPGLHPAFPSPRAIDPSGLRYLFHKQLQNSDVNQASRIVLPKGATERHLPVLHEKEGFFMNMDDMDGLRVWRFKFRFWPNNRSRMYVLEYTGDFTRVHGLCSGDYIMLYKDDLNEKYVIRAHKGPIQDKDLEIATNNSFSPVDEANDPFANFPTTDEMGTPFPNDNTTFYDFPVNYSSESLPDYLRLQQMQNLESSSFSLEDIP